MRRIAIIGAVLAVAVCGTATAGDRYPLGDLVIEDPWARASAGPARTGIAYLSIRNGGGTDDRLIAATADIARKAGLHTHIKDGDVMKMRPADGVAVKAGHGAMLAPGGDHIMLMGLKAPLKEGERFPLSLTFEKAGMVTVEVEIKAAGAMGGGHGKHRP